MPGHSIKWRPVGGWVRKRVDTAGSMAKETGERETVAILIIRRGKKRHKEGPERKNQTFKLGNRSFYFIFELEHGYHHALP